MLARGVHARRDQFERSGLIVWQSMTLDNCEAGGEGRRAMGAASVRSFAEAVAPTVLIESRIELLRGAQHYLREWERTRDDVTRGRLLQVLDDLAVLVARD
jgi:hypothetical protein